MRAKATYRAVLCSELGPPERLNMVELPRAELAGGSVRVGVKAAGLNFPDWLMVQGLYQYKPDLPFVPGMEAAGIIDEVQPGVTSFAPGDKVMVRMRAGAFAEEAVVAADQVLPLPAAFGFEEGATFLAAHTTAYHALKTRAEMRRGQSLLVLGAAGWVGLAAVQIGKLLGARIIAAASTEQKLALAREAGADDILNYTRGRIEDGVHDLTDGRGVDVLFDPVGIAQDSALRCLTRGGKLLVVGFAGGHIPSYAANRILLRGCSVIGVRAGEAGRHDPEMRRREHAELCDLAGRGRVRPHVSEVYPLEQCAAALRRFAGRQAVGRIALRVNPR
ncbi:MAG: NADPH:quinone oxidoreductase family protein [Methylobacteriaceae bacterium]|nr:NADPH:quinone oxidoreductase family protein [Methylobacteriaceae bacterium]